METLYTLQSITIDFFTAYGLYTLSYLLIAIFVKKPIIKKIDNEANSLISFIGVIFILVWITGNIVEYFYLTENEKISYLNRITGRYWFGFWIQPLLWFTITQLLRFEKAQKNILIRILFSLLLILSLERITILLVSLHRDYLPSSWTMYSDLSIYPSNLFLMLILKIMAFILFARIYGYINLKVKPYILK